MKPFDCWLRRDWSEGYPGGIVYDERNAVVIDTGQIACRYLEGE